MKVATNKYGIEHIITATNEDNERQVEMMVGKAMCAWANYLQAVEMTKDTKNDPTLVQVGLTAHMSEYEATVRCIALFVDQPTSFICNYVIARCFEEFGIC